LDVVGPGRHPLGGGVRAGGVRAGGVRAGFALRAWVVNDEARLGALIGSSCGALPASARKRQAGSLEIELGRREERSCMSSWIARSEGRRRSGFGFCEIARSRVISRVPRRASRSISTMLRGSNV
jgi:hypothetical protein